jgi:hypothetical protein
MGAPDRGSLDEEPGVEAFPHHPAVVVCETNYDGVDLVALMQSRELIETEHPLDTHISPSRRQEVILSAPLRGRSEDGLAESGAYRLDPQSGRIRVRDINLAHDFVVANTPGDVAGALVGNGIASEMELPPRLADHSDTFRGPRHVLVTLECHDESPERAVER